MPLSALGLVLVAAALHASWNLLVKASRDRLVAAWAQSTIGAAVFLPVLVVQGLPLGQWHALAASAVVHLGYALTLVAGYDHGDLSVVYPIARGSAPILVTAGAAVLLDDRPGALGLVAVLLIAGGILAMIRRSAGGVGWALMCGGFIAGYTLIDGAAVRSGGGPFRYVITLIAVNALTLSVVVLVRRGRSAMADAVRRDGWRNTFGGVASVVAYAFVLTAARWAPLGLVSAVRETSVVLGALGGWLLLGEPLGPSRVVAAVTIAAGIAVLVAV